MLKHDIWEGKAIQFTLTLWPSIALAFNAAAAAVVAGFMTMIANRKEKAAAAAVEAPVDEVASTNDPA